MKLSFTSAFEKKASKLCQKNPQLRAELLKQFSLFRANPCHPSLKIHKLQGKRSMQYAVWIKGDLRALGIKDDDCYIFFDLVTHDQY